MLCHIYAGPREDGCWTRDTSVKEKITIYDELVQHQDSAVWLNIPFKYSKL